MAIDLLYPMEACYNDQGSKKAEVHNNAVQQQQKLSPFERLTTELSNDERVAREITMGKRIGFYRIKGNLGSGNFSQVKLGYHCLAKEKVAVKILDKTKLDQKTQRLLSREISSMEELRHPNIIRIYEVLETLTKIHIFMEYAPGGELFHKILNQGKLSEEKAKHYFSQVLSAVEHMHNNHIIHRDLKAENVFISHYETVKVGDFGFSTVSKPDEVLNTFCGSPPYAAPELFRDENYVGIYVDIWALGVMIYFMVTGTMPFRAETVGKLKKRILEGIFTIPDHVSDTCCTVLHGVLKSIPDERLSIKDIAKSKWLQGIEYPDVLPNFETKPKITLNECRPDELQANKSLRNLGIDVHHIKKLPHDSRSNITGTYRILLHQLQRRAHEEQMEATEAEKKRLELEQQKQQQTRRKDKRKSSKFDRNNNESKQIPRSKLCVIL